MAPREYARACVEIGAQLGVPTVNLWSAFQQQSSWQSMFKDGLHPNAEGGAFIYGQVGLAKGGRRALCRDVSSQISVAHRPGRGRQHTSHAGAVHNTPSCTARMASDSHRARATPALPTATCSCYSASDLH